MITRDQQNFNSKVGLESRNVLHTSVQENNAVSIYDVFRNLWSPYHDDSFHWHENIPWMLQFSKFQAQQSE